MPSKIKLDKPKIEENENKLYSRQYYLNDYYLFAF